MVARWLLPVLAVFASAAEGQPAIPREATPLPVRGYNDASHVGPAGDEKSPGGEGARPLVVVLHGNYDRPEWECDLWSELTAREAWVLGIFAVGVLAVGLYPKPLTDLMDAPIAQLVLQLSTSKL